MVTTQISSSLPRVKAGQRNFQYCDYEMHQHLVKKGYMGYIKGTQKAMFDLKYVDFPTLETWARLAYTNVR